MENKNKQELKKERLKEKKFCEKMKKTILGVVSLSVVAYGVFWIATLPKVEQADVVSRNGIHWHSTLSILIKGEKVEIPAGIGLGAVHNPMHTHGPGGEIHLEYGGVVREDDTRLSRFFEIWGEDFTSTSLMGNVSESDGAVSMMVNGKKNTEFGNYMIKDGDVIEIVFE